MLSLNKFGGSAELWPYMMRVLTIQLELIGAYLTSHRRNASKRVWESQEKQLEWSKLSCWHLRCVNWFMRRLLRPNTLQRPKTPLLRETYRSFRNDAKSKTQMKVPNKCDSGNVQQMKKHVAESQDKYSKLKHKNTTNKCNRKHCTCRQRSRSYSGL